MRALALVVMSMLAQMLGASSLAIRLLERWSAPRSAPESPRQVAVRVPAVSWVLWPWEEMPLEAWVLWEHDRPSGWAHAGRPD